MICKFAYCRKESRTKGYCRGHYTQLYRGEELRPLREKNTRKSVEEQIQEEIALEQYLVDEGVEDDSVEEAKSSVVLTPDEVTRAWRNRLRPGYNP